MRIDSVVHGKTGILVPHGDPDALAQEVVALLIDADRRSKMSQAAVAWSQQFNWEQTARSCLELLTRQVQDVPTKIPATRRKTE